VAVSWLLACVVLLGTGMWSLQLPNWRAMCREQVSRKRVIAVV